MIKKSIQSTLLNLSYDLFLGADDIFYSSLACSVYFNITENSLEDGKKYSPIFPGEKIDKFEFVSFQDAEVASWLWKAKRAILFSKNLSDMSFPMLIVKRT